jgi:hypothetical protein
MSRPRTARSAQRPDADAELIAHLVLDAPPG